MSGFRGSRGRGRSPSGWQGHPQRGSHGGFRGRRRSDEVDQGRPRERSRGHDHGYDGGNRGRGRSSERRCIDDSGARGSYVRQDSGHSGRGLGGQRAHDDRLDDRRRHSYEFEGDGRSYARQDSRGRSGRGRDVHVHGYHGESGDHRRSELSNGRRHSAAEPRRESGKGPYGSGHGSNRDRDGWSHRDRRHSGDDHGESFGRGSYRGRFNGRQGADEGMGSDYGRSFARQDSRQTPAWRGGHGRADGYHGSCSYERPGAAGDRRESLGERSRNFQHRFSDEEVEAYNDRLTPRRIYVGELHHHTTEDGLREYFSDFGSVVEAEVLTFNPTGLSKRKGFVTFHEERSVEAVLGSKKHHILDGVRIMPRKFHKKVWHQRALPFALKVTVPEMFGLTLKQLVSYFQLQAADYVTVKMPHHPPPDGRQGFAIVHFSGSNDDSIESILAMGVHHTIDGQLVDVRRHLRKATDAEQKDRDVRNAKVSAVRKLHGGKRSRLSNPSYSKS